MYKHRLLTWAILGLLLNLQGFSQSKPAAGAKAGQCNARVAAYQSARDNCLDAQQQLTDLQRQINAYRKQREDLLQQCNDAKDARDLAVCKEAAGLADGHVILLEQEYSILAQRGCQQTAVTPQQIARICADEGFTDPSAPASNQKKPAPLLSTKTPVKSATVPSQQPSTVGQQGISPDRSVSNTHSRPQPSPSPSGAGAPAGNGFNRQADVGGSMRGPANTPSPAAISAGTGSTGAGRVK